MNHEAILVIEDDYAIRNLITTTLETNQYKFKTATTGAQAMTEAVSKHYDVILLDLGLPDMDGVDIIKKVRSWSNVPIIVVSARTEDKDKICLLYTSLRTLLKILLSGRLRVRSRIWRWDRWRRWNPLSMSEQTAAAFSAPTRQRHLKIRRLYPILQS